MPDVNPISWCGHSAADACLPVQTHEVGTAAPAAAPSPPTQAGDILLTATDPFLVQTAEGLLAAQIEADNEITVEYEGMPMLVKVQHVYSVDEVERNIVTCSSGRPVGKTGYVKRDNSIKPGKQFFSG